MRRCPICQTELSETAKFCDQCGYSFAVGGPEAPATPSDAALGTPAGLCAACGYQNLPGEMFCQNCGVQLAPLITIPPVSPRPSPAQPSPDASAADFCPQCHYPRSAGDLFCQNCGVSFATAPPSQEAPPAPQAPYPPVESPLPFPQPVPAPQASPVRAAALIIRESGVRLPLPLERGEIVIGRSDVARDIYPDIDLAPHGGSAHGVSRQHARLIVTAEGLYLVDLNSTNFTFLNQRRLEAGQPYPLQNGDEIRLGLMVLDYEERAHD